jgi:hypothetical protein
MLVAFLVSTTGVFVNRTEIISIISRKYLNLLVIRYGKMLPHQKKAVLLKSNQRINTQLNQGAVNMVKLKLHVIKLFLCS